MMELLSQLADPEVIHTLSASDKLLAGLATTLLGMGITFLALIVLQVVIAVMERLLNRSGKPLPVPAPPRPAAAVAAGSATDNRELIAVITAVLANQLGTRPERIVIRNIESVHNQQPAWGRAGIIEQMNSRL